MIQNTKQRDMYITFSIFLVQGFKMCFKQSQIAASISIEFQENLVATGRSMTLRITSFVHNMRFSYTIILYDQRPCPVRYTVYRIDDKQLR